MKLKNANSSKISCNGQMDIRGFSYASLIKESSKDDVEKLQKNGWFHPQSFRTVILGVKGLPEIGVLY